MPREYGDIRDEIRDDLGEEVLVCFNCGTMLVFDLQHFGLDWPDAVLGWQQTKRGFTCPICTVSA